MSSGEIILTAAIIVCPLISLVVAIIVARRSKDKDTKQDGVTLGQILTDIVYIKSGIDDLKESDKHKDEKIDDLSERVISLETKVEDHIKNRHIHVAQTKKIKK